MSNFLKHLFAPIAAILSFIQNYFKALLFLLLLLVVIAPTDTDSSKAPNLAMIDLTGPIIDARKIIERIEQIGNNPTIRGALLYVDSPGGAVAPSVEIALAIKRLKTKKPVVAYAAGTMASGSYYAAIWSNAIIANPAATIGSIGVIMEGINLNALMQKVGIAPQVIKAGRYKEAGTPFRQWTAAERQAIETHVKDIYHLFVGDVARARGLDLNQSDRFAQARIFIAAKAKQVGLIDAVGDLSKAKAHLASLSGVDHPRWQKPSRWERVIERLDADTLLRQMASHSTSFRILAHFAP